MSEEKHNRIEIENIPQAEQDVTDEEAKNVQGGLIGLLVPAVQKVRATEDTSTTDTSATGNVVQGNLIGTD